MLVEVYRNLTKGCLSVRHKGKVVNHVNSLLLHRCEFKVQPGGRARVLATKRKNVHAFVKGEWLDEHYLNTEHVVNQEPVLVSYNPYTRGVFVGTRKNGTTFPIHKAACVLISGKNIIAWDNWE